MCFRLCCCCCPSSDGNNGTSKPNMNTPEEQRMIDRLNQKQQANGGTPLTEEEEKDYENLIYIAKKRQIKVTVKTGAKAGMMAGLMVMGGVIVAGPIGAVVGGAIGTAAAATMSSNTITLNELLMQTPAEKRGEVYRLFQESMKEEFQQGFTESPELRLLLSGGTIMGVMRYCLDRDLIESEKLQKLDNILAKIG